MKTTMYVILAVAAMFSLAAFWMNWQLVAAVMLIVLGFSALVTYSVWFLFFGPEALFSFSFSLAQVWHIITQGEVFQPAQGTAYDNSGEGYELEMKLKKMEARRDALLAELEKKYDSGKLRQVNILSHHIFVTTARINGDYNCPDSGMENLQWNKHIMKR